MPGDGPLRRSGNRKASSAENTGLSCRCWVWATVPADTWVHPEFGVSTPTPCPALARSPWVAHLTSQSLSPLSPRRPQGSPLPSLLTHAWRGGLRRSAEVPASLDRSGADKIHSGILQFTRNMAPVFQAEELSCREVCPRPPACESAADLGLLTPNPTL